MQAHMPSQPSTDTPTASAVASTPRTYGEHPQRCTWCYSLEHHRRDCNEFTEALQQNHIHLNERGHVVSNVNGEEFPLMIGNGGMKRFIALTTVNVVPSAISRISAGGNNITLESYGNLGPQSSVMITTLDLENGTRMDEIIDAEVNEKRRRDDILHRRVRPHLKDTLPCTP